MRTLLVGAVVALAACGGGEAKQDTATAGGDIVRQGDTIAVPAVAVDTSSPRVGSGANVQVGAPGAGTAESGRTVSPGVDTPITHKIIGKEAEAKKP